MSTQGDPQSSVPSDSSRDSTEDTHAKAQELAERAQQQAQSVAGQAQDRVREQVDQRSTQIGEQISQHASDLRAVSQALRDQGRDRPAQLTDRMAGYAEQAASYLQNKDGDSLLSDAETSGARSPRRSRRARWQLVLRPPVPEGLQQPTLCRAGNR